MPDLDDFLRDQAKKLRAGDEPPATKAEWERRRAALREKLFAAMGPAPEKPCALEPRVLGTLKRDGYAIEKLVFQSRPNVWVTATAYVPEAKGKVPAVLCVHGHWAGARRDPVVQARCLGLVKLGFFVLVVDAFGAGERFTNPANGTYHGALYGATLWPTGHTLLGMQVYDNRRAVDYLLGRPEVNGKLGVTGASGGGNQTMYAGALDDRLAAVVPVCSVGNYQAYLKAACCVCEVLPGALTFTEEGDVLGLVAPRALLVINASKDAIQFSPAEAEKSVARAKTVFKLHDAEPKLRHQIFESPHAYNQAMREAMYGWMTLHLKGEAKGDPIPEPKHTIEKPEDLACYPDPKDRPKGFLTPPLAAAAVGKEMVANVEKLMPDHPEMWEATANLMRDELKKVLNYVEPKPRLVGMHGIGVPEPGEDAHYSIRIYSEDSVVIRGATVRPDGEGRLPLEALVIQYPTWDERKPPPIWDILKKKITTVGYFTPRGTGEFQPKNDAIAGAPDHNTAEHSVWLGRALLSQWVTDIKAVLIELGGAKSKKMLVGIGPMAIPVLIASAFFQDEVKGTILIDPPVSFLSDTPYAAGTPMGILAPGILKVGDVPHLAGLVAPRRLVIAGGATLNGKKLTEKELRDAFAFTTKVYQATKAAAKLTITTEPDWNKIEL
jgi:dienelactone hydrolase